MVAVGLLVAADDAKKDDKGSKGLDGTWKITDAQENGKAQDQAKEFHFVFSGKKFSIKKGDDTLIEGTFTLDEKKKPKAIDLKLTKSVNPNDKGKTAKGIIEVKKGELKLCIAKPGTDTRPDKFETSSGDMRLLVTLKKEEKKEKKEEKKEKE
jgi:uncharacterized protein (TIGR03067 family)